MAVRFPIKLITTYIVPRTKLISNNNLIKRCIQHSPSLFQGSESQVNKSPQDSQNKNNLAAKPTNLNLDTQFSDPQATCENKTTREVLRGFIVFKLCSIKFLVDNNAKVMKLCRSILGKTVFGWLMKATFYGHFVAGEDEEKIVPTIKRLQAFGVNCILDYSVEEDISQKEAEELELSATRSESREIDQPSKADEFGGEMPQYQSHKQFADRRYKVSSARTFFYLNEATCEKNVENFTKSLLTVATHTQCSGIIAIKLTALGRPQILLQLSEVIMRTRSFVSELAGGQGNVISHPFTTKVLEQNLREAGITDISKFLKNVVTDKHGVIHLFPWSGILNENFEINDTFRIPSRKEGRMVRLISRLTDQEEAMFRNMIRRLNTLITTAKELDVRLVIDAEQSYFQPAISRITMEMMNKYNTDRAIVLNTYQCYLKETFNEISSDLKQSQRQNFYFGAKIVRGAYLDQERERAAELKYPDPTNSTYEDTTDMYYRVLTECLQYIKSFKDQGQPKRVTITVATHNEDTVKFAIEQMKNVGISPGAGVISFGQLYGMCDFLTFPLGKAGYSSYKYIPYGPMNEVLPYLSRRAFENRSVLAKLNKEKYLLRKELVRRLIRGKIFHKPVGKYGVVC